MSSTLFSRAAADVDKLLAPYGFLDSSTRGGLLIFGATGLVTLLVVAWAVFLRKRRRRRHSHHRSHRHSAQPIEAPPAPADEAPPSPPRERRRWRRQRRQHHPRNPTLAETGGLPPIRPEGPSEPQP